MSIWRRTLVRVFDGTAVGAGAGDWDRLAGHGVGQGFVEVVARALQVLLVGCGFVVDGALIDELAGWIDDEDVGRGLGFVETGNRAGGVEERSGGSGVHGFEVGVLFGRRDVALLARGR